MRTGEGHPTQTTPPFLDDDDDDDDNEDDDDDDNNDDHCDDYHDNNNDTDVYHSLQIQPTLSSWTVFCRNSLSKSLSEYVSNVFVCVTFSALVSKTATLIPRPEFPLAADKTSTPSTQIFG